MERIRDLGYSPGQKWLKPGPLNSITDVPGVCVGVKTLRSRPEDDKTPSGPDESVVMTGVTSILPRPGAEVLFDPCYAATFQLNGTGEMSGSHMIDETGIMHTPILIGGTSGIGAMIEGSAKWSVESGSTKTSKGRKGPPFVLPVIAETSDQLTDMTKFSVRPEDAIEALHDAKKKQRPEHFEGSKGGGTGMICQGFKGGNGTSSRVIPGFEKGKEYTLGAFVQANFGTARDFVINGLPIGKALIESGFHGEAKKKAEHDHNTAEPWDDRKDGSIIVILATDMPLMPHQLARLCRRIPIGLARVGAIAHYLSGDIFLAFSTQSTIPHNPIDPTSGQRVGPIGLPAVITSQAEIVNDPSLNTIFYAVADVVEEAVLNALCAAKDEVGTHGRSAKGLPHQEVKDILAKSKEALKDIFPGQY